MTAVSYPSSLPAPQRWAAVPRERRAVSPLPGNTQLRNRVLDQIQDIEAQWTYTPAQMEVWRSWFEDDLVKGQRWFSVAAPGAGGWIERVVRFRTGTVRKDYLGAGIWRVSARLEQRGRAAAPVSGSARLGLLDPWPDMWGCWGIELLRGNYVGPFMRVRNAATSEERDFGPVDDGSYAPVDIAAIAAFLDGATGDVQTFYDHSGNGRDMTASITPSQVRVQVDDGALLFLGNTSSSVVTTATSTAGVSKLSALLKLKNLTNDGRFFSQGDPDSGTGALMFYNNSNAPADILCSRLNGPTVADTSLATAEEFSDEAGVNVLGVRWDRTPTFGAEMHNVYVNGVQRSINSVSADVLSNAFGAGAWRLNHNSGVNAAGFEGGIFAVWERGIESDEMAAISAAMQAGGTHVPADDDDPGEAGEEPPAPSLPTPGDYTTPRVFGLDYTPDYTTAHATAHAGFGFLTRSFSTGKAASRGEGYHDDLVAINAACKLVQYVILNELLDPVASNHDFYPLWLEVTARNWWARKQPGNLLTRWTDEYSKYELNPTSAVTANGAGERLSQYKAEHFDFQYRLNNLPDVLWLFIDNFWRQPRATADYNCDGVNDTPASVGAAWRAGFMAYVTALKALRPGLKIIANVNHALADSEYAGLIEGAFNEGCIGKDYGTFERYGISNAGANHGARERQLALAANTADGMAILNGYISSLTDYQGIRFGLTMSMLFDSWYCPIYRQPGTGHLQTKWADEFEQPIGVRTGSIPSAAWSNGVWKQEFENGIVLCNPTSSAQSVDPTGLGSFTRFSGSQAPSVNTGAAVSGPITIPARDGLLLLTA